MATQSKQFIPVEEYLRLEETAEERHEYFNGEVFTMSGGTPNHADIAVNLIGECRVPLRQIGCRIRGSDLGIKLPGGLYTYPDATISCAPEYDGNFLLNPVVIFEVLSDSTEAYDRGRKFERYREIPAFREYVLIAQDRMYVEHSIRQTDREWMTKELKADQDQLCVVSLAVPVSVLLSSIYADVAF